VAALLVGLASMLIVRRKQAGPAIQDDLGAEAGAEDKVA
jgi:hypothetical protein